MPCLLAALPVVLLLAVPATSISCFTCTSRNHSDPHCEDPMSPHYSQASHTTTTHFLFKQI